MVPLAVTNALDSISVPVQLLQPSGLVSSPAFSHVAVIPGDATIVLIGGQNGVNQDGALVSADVGDQAVQAVRNARTSLAAAGASLEDVVQWTVLLHADADLTAAYRVVGPQLTRSGPPPLVVAARVAALGVPGALLEISAIAALSPSS